MQCSICHNLFCAICKRDSSAPESGWTLLSRLKYICCFTLPVHIKFATNNEFRCFAASFSQFDWCHLSWNRSAAGTSNVGYQLTSSHMVINNNQWRQWNPTLATSNSRFSNSNIRTLIHFNIEKRNDIALQYSVLYKWPFSLFVPVKRSMLLECLKRNTLMKCLTL
jgi:hypothetical protein